MYNSTVIGQYLFVKASGKNKIAVEFKGKKITICQQNNISERRIKFLANGGVRRIRSSPWK